MEGVTIGGGVAGMRTGRKKIWRRAVRLLATTGVVAWVTALAGPRLEWLHAGGWVMWDTRQSGSNLGQAPQFGWTDRRAAFATGREDGLVRWATPLTFVSLGVSELVPIDAGRSWFGSRRNSKSVSPAVSSAAIAGMQASFPSTGIGMLGPGQHHLVDRIDSEGGIERRELRDESLGLREGSGDDQGTQKPGSEQGDEDDDDQGAHQVVQETLATPEPGALWLVASGLVALLIADRSRRRRTR